MTARRRVAFAVSAAIIVLTASPALGQSDPVVVFYGPAEGEFLADSTMTVTGRVDRSDLLMTEIIVTLVADGPASEPIRPIEPNVKPVPEFAARFKVPKNGRYTANVEVRRVLDGVLQPVRGSRTFVVAVPPAPPTDVKVEVSPERAVTVSWAPNSEPDVYYLVSRKNEADGKLALAGGRVAQPESGRVSLVDPFPAQVGGDFSYQVVALIPGPIRGATPLRSPPGTSDKVSVAAPATTTAAPGAGGAGLFGTFPPAQTGTTARPRPLAVPDTGFSETLPFGALPAGGQIEEGEQEPRTLDVGTTTSEFVSRGRPLVPVAAGAILLLLAVHLRLLNQRVKPVPATVGGPAYSDLALLDDGGFHRDDRFEPPVVQPRPVTRARAPEPARVGPAQADLFDYEHEQPAKAVPDEAWAEREWEDEIREVDAQIRDMVGARRP